MVKTYYQLTKPGIVYGNAIAAIAGFFLGSRGQFNLMLFLAMLIGICLVMASACVFNNYIDRDIDARMERTKKRAFVAGTISVKNALIFATVLVFIGFIILFLFTNVLTVCLGFIGFFFYIVLYGIGKRKSIHGTLIGSVSGSIPLVAGYTAVTNNFDTGALLLFLILAIWQMPHFYAIALYRSKDYTEAKLPVMPVVKGVRNTQIQIICYIIAFLITTSLLTFFHYTSYTFLILMIIINIYWLWLAIKGLQTKDVTKWAKSVFRFSLIVLLVFCFLLTINTLLP